MKILTGDNELVTRTICTHVGLPSDVVMLGTQVAEMSDKALAEAVEQTTIFARLTPCLLYTS